MNNCTECTKTETICQETNPCGCPIPDLSTDCVKYDGPTLECSGITSPNTLTQIIQKLDAFICDKISNTFIGELLNIGGGAEIYKQTNNLTGRQEIRTLESSDGSITITQTDNTINLELTEGVGNDKYVNLLSFNGSILTVGFNTGPDLTIDISSVNTDNFLSESPVFNTNTGEITFTMEDGTTYTVDISELQQTQSNVLELDNNSPAFIKNQNKVDVVTTNYSIKAEDNNRVILLDTSIGDIIVDLNDSSLVAPNIPPNDNFFVGFIQKGLGEVTFINFDIKPVQYTNVLQGEGHNAAVEIIGGERFLFGALNEIV